MPTSATSVPKLNVNTNSSERGGNRVWNSHHQHPSSKDLQTFQIASQRIKQAKNKLIASPYLPPPNKSTLFGKYSAPRCPCSAQTRAHNSFPTLLMLRPGELACFLQRESTSLLSQSLLRENTWACECSRVSFKVAELSDPKPEAELATPIGSGFHKACSFPRQTFSVYFFRGL